MQIRHRERDRQLMKSLDRINAEMGEGTLRYAVSGTQHPWRARCERRSPGYTTCWEELPLVKAV
jgi:DNA polymerase V